ncbi:MAG: hypothetical protein R3C01_12135 [Planctomycetaceae bacterium]
MAKKKAAKSGFNMSAAIRAALEANNDASNKEALDAVQAANPGVDINVNSFGVALSGLRKKMGISKGPGRKKKVLVKKPAAATATGAPKRAGRPKGSKNKKKAVTKAVPAVSVAAKTSGSAAVVSIQALQAARKFVSELGNADNAIAAIRQLTELQM